MQSKDYQKGYAAGRKKRERDMEEMRRLSKNIDRTERIYMQCLDMALKHCSGWTIGGKEINDAAGYCRIAKVFADNAISEMGGE